MSFRGNSGNAGMTVSEATLSHLPIKAEIAPLRLYAQIARNDISRGFLRIESMSFQKEMRPALRDYSQ
jgi:hypothetical protein